MFGNNVILIKACTLGQFSFSWVIENTHTLYSFRATQRKKIPLIVVILSATLSSPFLQQPSTMSNSFNLLLDIPEFIHLLDPYLDQGDVSSLARTCRKMHSYWTPSVYRSLEVVYGHNFKLFCSTPALLALARNIHYTRKVKFGVDELRYYYNCVLDFEEAHSRIIDTPRSRPSWLPPSDIRTCEVVALPPMSCLSRLHLNLGLSRKRLYSVSSIENPRTRLAQIC